MKLTCAHSVGVSPHPIKLLWSGFEMMTLQNVKNISHSLMFSQLGETSYTKSLHRHTVLYLRWSIYIHLHCIFSHSCIIVAYVQVSLKQILNHPQRFRCNFEAMSLRYFCRVSVVASLVPWILTDVMSIKRRETTKVKLQIKKAASEFYFSTFGGVWIKLFVH